MNPRRTIRWSKLFNTGLFILLLLVTVPRQVYSAEGTISITLDAHMIWGYYENGRQAIENDDWVKAHQSLRLAWPFYNLLRGNPDSPFHLYDSEAFYNDFNAALMLISDELAFWVHQYPREAGRRYEELGNELEHCKFQLSGRDRSYNFQLPYPDRPSKPHLPRIPPPKRARK